MAKLSVIIPCYNGYEYLKEMVDCCMRQSFTDWELIIVDDGSVDDTFGRITSYTANDTRIQVYKRDRFPKGSLTCRNIGFEHSSGQYIIHFDADDILADDCFERRVKFMDEHSECDYATFLAQGFHHDKKNEIVYDRYYGVEDTDHDLLERFLTISYPFSIWCNIYRRKIVEKYPWDENVRVYSDFSYALPMIFDGVSHLFAHNETPDYLYRRFYSKKNMCASAVDQDKCKSTIYLFNNILRKLSDRDDSEIRKQQFLRFVVLHYERLMLGNKVHDIEDYIRMLTPFYDSQTIDNLYCISERCLSISNNYLMKITLDYLLYRKFKFPIYKTQLFHSLIKPLLFKK